MNANRIVALIRADNTLKPAYRGDLEIVQKFRRGKEERMVLADLITGHNPAFHRLIFAIARCCLDNMPEGTFWSEVYRRNPGRAPYLFIKALELEIGLVDEIYMIDGTVKMVPASIAYHNLSDEEKQPIVDRACEICAGLIGTTTDEFCRNYPRYL